YHLCYAWQPGAAGPVSEREEKELLRFLGACRVPAHTWAVVELVLQNARPAENGEVYRLKRKALDAACVALAGGGGRDDAVPYHRATLAFQAGERGEARKLFADLYNRTLDDGALPPLDGTFVQALTGDAPVPWQRLLRQAARRFLDRNQGAAVLL